MEEPAAPVSLESLLAHREWVRQVARALVVDESRADDLEQETWLEAMRRPPPEARSLRGWLGTVLRHKAVDAGRSEARRERREEAAARVERLPDPAAIVEEADTHQRIVKAVLDLDEPYRSTVLLRYFEDLGPAEIAGRGSIPLETVRTRLRRGLEILRERFGRESGGDDGAWRRLVAPLAMGARAAGGVAAATSGAGVLGTLKARVAVTAGVAALAGAALIWAAQSPGRAGAGSAGGDVAVAPPPRPVAAPAEPGNPGFATAPAALPPAAGAGAAKAPVPAAVPANPAQAAPPPAAPPATPPEPPPEVAGKASLEVLVFDRRGDPIPGVEVRIHGPGRPLLNADMDLLEMVPPAPRPAVRQGVADARGRFAGEGLAPGTYWARSTAPGFAAATAVVRLEGEAGKGVARLLLEPEAVLSGVVRRADGKPAPGVRVVARRFTGRSFLAFDRVTAVSGPDGAYRIGGLAPGVHEISTGPAPGQLIAAGAVEVPEVATFNPVIPAGATLRGKVLDDVTGRPIAGASVLISTSDPELHAVSFSRALTGADGTYALEGLPGGSDGWLHVRQEGYLPSFDEGSDPKARVQGLVAGGEFLRDVRLLRGGRVTGQVKDPEGRPVADAYVHVETFTTNGMRYSPVAVSGADGRYSMGPAVPGRSVLLVQAMGYAQRDVGNEDAWNLIRENRIPESAAVDVRQGESVARDVVLDPVPGRGPPASPSPAVLAGRIRRWDGADLKGLRLRLIRDEEGSSAYWNLRQAVPAPVREDGTFRIEGLAPGRVAVVAEADGCALATGAWAALEPGKVRDGYVLSLSKGYGISGKVVDAEGNPVVGAGIRVDGIAERHALAVTDGKGGFSLTGLAEGNWVLTALVPGAPGSSATAEAGAIDVALKVHRPAPGAANRLVGRVVDAETGEGIPDVTVQKSWEGMGSIEDARTDREGRFSLPAGYGGRQEIIAGLTSGNASAESDYVPAEVELEGPPKDEIRIALRKGSAIAGRVLNEDGSPARRRLHIEVDGDADPGWPFFSRMWFLDSRDDGTFRIRGLPPGKFDLVFEDSDDPAFTPIVVRGVRAGTEDLAVQQQRALPIAGRVVDEEGKPPGVPGWVQPLIRGRQATGPALPVTKVGGDGVFRTCPIHVGDVVDLRASKFEGFVEATVESVEPGATEVVVRIRRGAAVSGRVVDEAGRPVPSGVPVRALLSGSGKESELPTAGLAKTDEAGGFKLAGMEGEGFLLEAGGLGSDYVSVDPRPPVKAGARDVVVHVRRGLTVSVVLVGGGDMVLLLATQGEDATTVHSVEGGRLLVRGLRPGKFRLRGLDETRDLGEFDASAGTVEIDLR